MTPSDPAIIRPNSAGLLFLALLTEFSVGRKPLEMSIYTANNILSRLCLRNPAKSGHAYFEVKKRNSQLRQRNDTPINPPQ
jgi:hypothetical protein